MTDVTVHIASSGWCVHFVVTATQIPIGPWLLFPSSDEIRKQVFAWGNVSAAELKQYEIDIRRWGIGTVHMDLTDIQIVALAERGRGWPWNGYELLKMKKAGRYPPARLDDKVSMMLKK